MMGTMTIIINSIQKAMFSSGHVY